MARGKKKAENAADRSAAAPDISNFDTFMEGVTNGIGSVTRVNPSTVTRWISSGSIPINLALSGHPANGFPLGRMLNFEGESDTGKSLLAQTGMREAQTEYKDMFRGMYIDTERGVAINRLEQMGMFCKKKPTKAEHKDPNHPSYKDYDQTGDPRASTFQLVQTTDLTTIADKLIPPFLAAARANPLMVFLLCIDSMSMLVTTHERTTSFDTRDMARAIEIRKLMRILNDLFPPNLTVMLIHHQSDRIATGGQQLGTKQGNHNKDISGGKAVKYVPDVRIEIDYGGTEKRGSGENARVIGQKCRISVVKTRLFKPMIKACVIIDHNYGFTRTGGLMDQLEQMKLIVEPSQGWFQCPKLFGDKKFQGAGNIQDEIEKSENAQQVVSLIAANLQLATFSGDDSELEVEAAVDEPTADLLAGLPK